MAHLGEFGRELAALAADEAPVEPDTFTFHGEPFTIRPDLSALPRMRYAHASMEIAAAGDRVQAMWDAAETDEEIAAARRADGLATAEWMAAQYRYLREAIGDGEWDRFEATATRVGADRQELVAVANAVMAVVAGRPPMRSSGSPGGLSSTGGGSTVASASTDGTQAPAPEPVREMTEAEKARAEIDADRVPVDAR